MAEPLIVPLAVPAIAGPSALATVLLLVSQQPERRLEWIAALCVTMAHQRHRAGIGRTHSAGDRVTRLVVAMERLMGLVLVSVAIEMMLRGIKTFVMQLMQG
jgi:small neutral amino acid transporter SnatA (MarC family)